MENNNIESSIDFKDKGATYWKWLVLEQVKLAAHYLQAMDGIERLEDLERHESDHQNFVELFTKPEIRQCFGLKWLEKVWHYQDVREIAVKKINTLAEDIDAMPVTHKAFARMANVRISEYSSRLENLEWDFFSAALEYAFGNGLQFYSYLSGSELFVKRVASFIELCSRIEWQRHAETSLTMAKYSGRNAEQVAG